MAYPIHDSNFILWQADLDVQLKQVHGVTAREADLPLRLLQELFYTGRSVAAALDQITRRHFSAPA